MTDRKAPISHTHKTEIYADRYDESRPVTATDVDWLNTIIQHFRDQAEGCRRVFTKTNGGPNAAVYDAWADKLATLKPLPPPAPEVRANPEPVPDVDELAKNLRMWLAGAPTERSLMDQFRVTRNMIWNEMAEHERDDYRFAVRQMLTAMQCKVTLTATDVRTKSACKHGSDDSWTCELCCYERLTR